MAAVKKDKLGNIISVKFDDNAYGIGRVITGGYIEFYNVKATQADLADHANKLPGANVIFTLNLHKSWKTNANWEVIGNNPNAIPQIPDQFMQNISNPSKIDIVSATAQRPGTYEEALKIERLAVWEDNHVEDRLRDHFNNKPNVWVEQMKPKKPSA